MLLPLSNIFVAPARQRSSMDPKKLEELRIDLFERRERGVKPLIQNIVVRQRRDDDAVRWNNGLPIKEEWILVAGGRRTAAHILLGWDAIQADNIGDLEPIEQEIAELHENIYREDISWQDSVNARARLHELRMSQDPTHTAEKSAFELKTSKGNLSKDLALVTMMDDPEVKAAPTKRAAMRVIERKVNIAARVMALSDLHEEDLRGKIHTADARDFIRTLKSQSVDLIFTDLPYGMGYTSPTEKAGAPVLGQYDDSPEKIKDLVIDLVPQMCRVLKPSGWMVLFFSVEGLPWLRGLIEDACATHTAYRAISNLDDDDTQPDFCTSKSKDSKCRFLATAPRPWIWYKPNARNISEWPDRYAKAMYENMLIVNGGQARITIQNQPDVLVHDAIYENRLHEMEKPRPLCLDIIKRLSIPGELVADFTFGSGRHLAAAAELGRDFIGCDNNPSNLPSALSLVAEFYRKST